MLNLLAIKRDQKHSSLQMSIAGNETEFSVLAEYPNHSDLSLGSTLPDLKFIEFCISSLVLTVWLSYDSSHLCPNFCFDFIVFHIFKYIPCFWGPL